MENPNLKKFEYTVGILIYHRTPELVEMATDCLGSVLNSVDRDKTEIIVVDNGSPLQDDYFKKNADTYIRFSENKGISRGWNAILRNARGKYIAILGDDTIVLDDWLEQLKKAMDMPLCGFANVHMEHLPQGTGLVENYKWPSGACFMVTPETIKKVGYFDENIFPCNWEDTDYFLRIYKAGLKMYRNYAITVLHKEGQTVHAEDLASRFEDGRQYIIQKHGFDPSPAFFADKSLLEMIQTHR